MIEHFVLKDYEELLQQILFSEYKIKNQFDLQVYKINI